MSLKNYKFVVCLLLICIVQHARCQLICNCDTVDEVCQVDCCCDEDCSDEEKQTFSQCINTPSPTDPSLCKFDSVVYNELNQPNITTDDFSSLFCLDKRNQDEVNFVELDCGETDCFKLASNQYSFQNVAAQTLVSPESSNFNAGDLIHVNLGNSEGIFTIKSSLNGYCSDDPVKYLEDKYSNCVFQLNNITDTCTSTSTLIPLFYYDFLIGNSTFITVNSCTLSGVKVDCASYPILTDSSCQAVRSVSYTVIINNNTYKDISKVLVDFVLDDLPLSENNFKLSFSVTFSLEEPVPQTITFSGNPGYILGKPLIGLLFNSNDTAVLQTNTGNALSFIKPDSTGLCNSAVVTRQPLLFNINMKSQCQIVYSASTLCSTLLTNVLYALEQHTLLFNNDNVYVSMLGNFTVSLQTGVRDVVPVLKEGIVPDYSSTTTVEQGCPGMIIGAQYTILYSKIGSIESAVNVVVGVRYKYETAVFFTNPCFTNDCATRESKLIVNMAVDYVDVSPPAESLFAQIIPIEFYFGDDFLFPFVVGNANSLKYSKALLLLFTTFFVKTIIL